MEDKIYHYRTSKGGVLMLRPEGADLLRRMTGMVLTMVPESEFLPKDVIEAQSPSPAAPAAEGATTEKGNTPRTKRKKRKKSTPNN